MTKSAGILLYRKRNGKLEVLLVHPGGPFWKNKDGGIWSIPKGEFTAEENALVAAKREFFEETGSEVEGQFIPLKPVQQNKGKIVYAWACEGELDTSKITSNLMNVEWPPRSGKQIQIPEVDKAEWFEIETAKQKILAGQLPLLDELVLKIE